MRNHHFVFDFADISENYWLVAPKEQRNETSCKKWDFDIESNFNFLRNSLVKTFYLVILPITLVLMNTKLVEKRITPLYFAIFFTAIEVPYLLYTILNFILFFSTDISVATGLILFLFFLFINFIFLANFLVKFSYFRLNLFRCKRLTSFIYCFSLSITIFILICLINAVLTGMSNIRLFNWSEITPFLPLVLANGLGSFFFHFICSDKKRNYS